MRGVKSVSEIEPNVTQISYEGKTFLLVGTAHVSKSSADLVEKVILDAEPDSVCIELCSGRLDSLRNPDAWRNTDVFRVIKEGKAYVLMTQIILATFQKRLAAQFGVRPGEEMRRAMELGKDKVVVVDRNIRTTLKRAWAGAGLFGFAKILASLLEGMFSKEEMNEAQIEELKTGDALSAVMSEFSSFLPGVKKALIDERDAYMAECIRRAPGSKIVAVLGAGHIPGIVKRFGEEVDLAELDSLPPASLLSKFLIWGFPLLLAILMIYGFMHGGTKGGLEVFGTWAISNMIGSALGTVAAFGHPLSILTAFLSGPFAAIHPVIAVGWLAALVEAFVRKPRVSDFEALTTDVTLGVSLWRNRVTRVFLVLILANFGSVIGSGIGLALASKGL